MVVFYDFLRSNPEAHMYTLVIYQVKRKSYIRCMILLVWLLSVEWLSLTTYTYIFRQQKWLQTIGIVGLPMVYYAKIWCWIQNFTQYTIGKFHKRLSSNLKRSIGFHIICTDNVSPFCWKLPPSWFSRSLIYH